MPVLVKKIVLDFPLLTVRANKHTVGIAVKAVEFVVGEVVTQVFFCEYLVRNVFVGPLPIAVVDVGALGLLLQFGLGG